LAAVCTPKTIGIKSSPGFAEGAHPLAAWLALIGLILPAAEMQIFIAGTKFTAGRIGVILLFIPALLMLCKSGRRLQLSDLFALATAAWSIGAAFYIGGLSSLVSASAETIELFCGYIAARGFFYGPAATSTFIKSLKFFAVTAIILAVADTISGRWIAHDAAAALFNTTALGPVYRGNMIRATSTLDHPILFGTFCSFVAAPLLYTEQSMPRRIFYVGLCFLGCVLSQSSAALMCISLVLGAYTYDRLMRRYSWRWTAFWLVVVSFISAVFLVSHHPIGWILSHMTLDPQSAYFRILIWDAAIDRIAQAPLTGFAFNPLRHEILDTTVDSVWLVNSLHYGIPMIVLLFLTNASAFWPTGQISTKNGNSYTEQMRRGFTVVLIVLIFVGVTVHYWNYLWIFWGLCIGVRASLREEAGGTALGRTERPAMRALEAGRGCHRDAGGDPAQVEGDPDGAGEVLVPGLRDDHAAASTVPRHAAWLRWTEPAGNDPV
jgi:hypothetical protein